MCRHSPKSLLRLWFTCSTRKCVFHKRRDLLDSLLSRTRGDTVIGIASRVRRHETQRPQWLAVGGRRSPCHLVPRPKTSSKIHGQYIIMLGSAIILLTCLRWLSKLHPMSYKSPTRTSGSTSKRMYWMRARG
ncbi:hypothetical protein C365_01874 [Cryptococcus neoformans Bt85]|nr:hypothetical protein C365_01874 [Cryptococcus neoformans var. grubii Bt85]